MVRDNTSYLAPIIPIRHGYRHNSSGSAFLDTLVPVKLMYSFQPKASAAAA